MSPAFELEACVTHWTIYRAVRREPYAAFSFKLCEEMGEHEVEIFHSVDAAMTMVEPGEET